jgi:putative membrane protein
MSRPRFNQSACDELADCVREIENQTDAEIVIAVRGRSGNYRHADYLCGAILAFAGLLFLLFAPFEFQHYWVAIDVVVLFALGAYISSRSNALRRLLTTEEYRAESVRQGAAAMFYDAGIANTEAEMGLLIYLSLLERRLELIADRGILKAAPPLEWNERVYELHRAGRIPQLETLRLKIQELGKLLAEHLPPTGENPNELPDMPRFDLK